MKTSENVAATVDRLPVGHVFSYTDINSGADGKEAVIKSLNRMVQAGKLTKLAKGKFYKPENTPFGPLQPDQSEVVKDLLEEDGKIIGYLTGYSIYNQLGLTTQVSNTIQIGKNDIRPAFKRERYTIIFIKQKNTITKDIVPLLQILDGIRTIKKIPDANLTRSAKRLMAIVKELSETEQKTMVRLALKYPPATRALLGAMLDGLQKAKLSPLLYKTLNPITVYKLAGLSDILSTAKKWNIR
ncbi:DUF6088 family protein [Nitrosomonas sp.]|uniref:DUF6088 family protein n=1 Tax=Nitrosomonas sp. TaxID=42353 RepID=UPI00374D4DBA